MIIRRMAVIALLLAMSTGCRNRSVSAGGAAGGPAATPRDALITMLWAMRDGNVAEICAVARLSDEQKRAVEAGVDLTRAGQEFRDAFVAAYGSDAWDKFQDPAHRPGDHDASLLLITDKDIADARQVPIREEGDRAAARMPRGRGIMLMVKVSGGWVIDGSTFVPPGTDAAATSARIAAVASTVRKYQRAIGKRGITPGDIDAELGLAIDEVFAGKKIDAPHRFDIDKL